VAVKIRLKRMGKIHAPFYRIVIADSRKKRDGRVIEEIGKYHPTENPSLIDVNSERAQYWLSVGAQPTEQVMAILKLTGDWGTFKGEKGAKNTVQQPEPKPEFSPDTKKKSVLKPKAKKEEKPAEPVAEEAAAPAEEAPAQKPRQRTLPPQPRKPPLRRRLLPKRLRPKRHPQKRLPLRSQLPRSPLLRKLPPRSPLLRHPRRMLPLRKHLLRRKTSNDVGPRSWTPRRGNR